MDDEENGSKAAIVDLNLYLGFPRSPRPRNLDMGSDLSLRSLTPTASSDSSESGPLEATSVAMEASASHAPSHGFIVEAGVPSTGPMPPLFENPIPPYYLAHGPCESTCAQATEGPNILYSPSNAQLLQPEQVFVEPEQRDEEYIRSLADRWGLNFVYDNSAQGDGSQAPYFLSSHPASANFHDEGDTDAFLFHLSQDRSELYSRTQWLLSQQALLQSLELPIQGLIESHGWRQSSLRPSLLCGTERTNLARHSSPSPEQLMQEITSSRQCLDTNGKKASAEVVAEDSSEKEAAEKNRCATDFDCNICFDIAKEPVVTSCGHLFCWPCLYQWLHVHSNIKECPVCKGEVTEANVTPIYGRGCSKSDDGNKDEENSDSGMPIPPRPRGNRLESLRQRFYTISPRVGEGIANPWRRFLNYQIQSRSRISGDEDTSMQEILSESPNLLLSSMSRRLQRLQGSAEGGPSTVERFPRDGDTVFGQGIYCFPAMNSEIGSAVGRFTENTNFYGSTSSVNSPNPGQFVSIPTVGARPAIDQAFASCTVAVISSENSARDASAEFSAGSPAPSRRSRGCSSSGSFDDGENLRKRRRLH